MTWRKGSLVSRIPHFSIIFADAQVLAVTLGLYNPSATLFAVLIWLGIESSNDDHDEDAEDEDNAHDLGPRECHIEDHNVNNEGDRAF